MKILHVCLSSHYTENMTYQDNQLPDQNAADGHEVIVVSDCYKYKGSDLVKTSEEDKVLESGVRLVRFDYDNIINDLISSKIRKVKKLKTFINDEKPDVILFHGAAGWELLTVAKYKKSNPMVKLYVDSHQDFHNSGTFWLSLFFQYKIFNRFLIRKVRRYVDKFLYLSYESRDFLVEMYGLNSSEIEFYPLGGNIISESRKAELSKKVRMLHGYEADDILVVHSGKLSSSKKTKELIEAFVLVKSEKLKLIIIGSIPNEEKEILEPLIYSDSRINFVGWKNAEELTEYLCAADIYFQPGTQSATMQNAICCGAPVALYPYESHEPYIKNNGFYVSSVNDYVDVLNDVLDDKYILKNMSMASYVVARKFLDYKILAARIY